MAGAIALSVTSAHSQSRPSSGCLFELAGTGKVRAITDGRSFALADGREVRLAGIEVPLPPRSDAPAIVAKLSELENVLEIRWAD